jgi:phosphoribosylanthranilate isomerase
MPVKVKICGITNLPDARAAAEAGADALGLVFYEGSPRFISFAAAAAIICELPPQILKVGLFVNAAADFVSRSIAECRLDLLQFHGEESPAYCVQFGLQSMKAFRIRDSHSLETLLSYKTDAWLLDAWSPDKHGGTGHTFDWNFAQAATKWGKPIYLAGGLTPENVGAGVRQVRPYAVDVSSGVELAPGKKDHAKIRAFVQAAKAAGG